MKSKNLILIFAFVVLYSCSAPQIDDNFLNEEYYPQSSPTSIKLNGSLKMQNKVDSLILELNRVQFKLLQMQLDYLTLSNNMMNLQLHSMELKLLQHIKEHELLALKEKADYEINQHTSIDKESQNKETKNETNSSHNQTEKQKDKSELELDKIHKKNIIIFNNMYEEGVLNFYKRKYKEAIDVFSSLLDLEDKDEDLIDNSYYWLGESYYALGNYISAIENFKKVIEIAESNKHADALVMLGQVYEKIGWKELARETYNKFVKEYPNNKNINLVKERLKKLL
jgi:TolA-binding protein